MKNLIRISFMVIIGLIPVILFGQSDLYHPTMVQTAVYSDVTPALTDLPMIQPQKSKTKPEDYEVKNKIGMKEFNRLSIFPFLHKEDPVWQKQDGTRSPMVVVPLQNFEGVGNLSAVYPPDTQGDVSGDFYVQVVNLNFAIYSKTGTLLYGPSQLKTIWTGIPDPWASTNSGDPVVLFDQAANRWIITQFSIPNGGPYAELIAISQTPDPMGAWNRYVFTFANDLPDYPKFGIWPDAYYMSINQFANASTWNGVGACAFERTKMLAGDPGARMIYFSLPNTDSDPSSMLPADWDGTITPPNGTPNYFTYFDDWTSPTNDYLKIWSFHCNWVNPSLSTFGLTYNLVTAPFKSEICPAIRGRCIPQPGTTVKLESLSDRLMFRMQYRNFGEYQCMVTNHSVDVDNTGHAGIRWYELRNSGTGWNIYQQSSYAPDASHRWMGSIAMNAQGDIALGYSVSNSSSVYPSIRYTGRRSGDPLNEMSIPEQTIIAGSGYQSGSASRWGDYSMMSVDPTDDQTFWYTNEYIQTSGTASWQTRIAAFRLANTPSVTTLAATAVTTSTATLNGTVNPNGLPTIRHFQYGTSTSYGSTTIATGAGSGTSSVTISAGISGLTPGLIHHFRAVAVNSDGTTYGNDLTFVPGGAVVATAAATSITATSAILGGNVLSEGGSPVTQRGFYVSNFPNPELTGIPYDVGSGPGSFSLNVGIFLANTQYFVKAFATNATTTTFGNEITFTTSCEPTVLPFYEFFDGPGIPACWTQQIIGVPAVNSWEISPTANAGALPNEMRSSWQSLSVGTSRLVSPAINTLGNSMLSISFRHMLDAYSTGAILKIQSSSDGVAWTDETWSVSTTNTNISAQIVNTTITHNVPNATTYVAFTVTGNLLTYDYWYLDDVVISGIPEVTTAGITCALSTAVSGGNVTNTGSSPVTARGVCWSQSPGPTLADDFTTDGSGTGAFSSALSGLIPSTTYHLRAYATNSSGTAYGAEGIFITPCAGSVSSFPWNEGFEHGGVIPSCWSQEQETIPGPSWTFTSGGFYGHPGTAHSGSYNAQLYYYNSSDHKTRLITPSLNLVSLANPQLSFWHTQAYWTPDQDILSIYYKTSVTGPWTLLASYTNDIIAWTQQTISLPNATGDYYVAFEGNAKWGYGVCIDDVQVTGTNLACPGIPTIDYGGKTYNTLQIGPQCWFRENVNIGTSIPAAQIPANNGTIEKYCYNDLTANCDIYGGLYTWDELMQYTAVEGAQGICPQGWHIPSDADWCLMSQTLDPTVNCNFNGYSGTDIGGQMKEAGLLHWSPPNTGATNSSNFTGLPGGGIYGTSGFMFINTQANFWTSTLNTVLNLPPASWSRILTSTQILLQRALSSNLYGFSARCLKDCEPVPAGISITASGNQVCSGTSVTFTAFPVNGGNAPSYQWKVNGVNTGSNSNALTYFPLYGDVVTCELTSNATCVTGNPATSNAISMIMNAVLPVSVSISASQNPVCSGESVTFTATPVNGGIVPSYQWRVNGYNYGTDNPVLIYAPADGDVVTCILTSNTLCTTGNPATSNAITMSVGPHLPVIITISASENPVCAGTSVTFAAIPVNEGTSPVYQWKVNGTNSGTNSPSFAYLPLNGDIVTCILTSNATCAQGSPATSNPISMTVNSQLPAGVTIIAASNVICSGSVANFTAFAINGGASPSYQWKVNGLNSGSNNMEFSYFPVNNDVVTCVVISSIGCATGNPATSNAITMSVIQPVPVSISVVPSANPVCSGTTVIYTATPVNGGTSPSYQWKVNGLNFGTNSPLFSYVPFNNDIISCVLTSDISCVTGNPATSNAVTMVVNDPLPVSITIEASVNPICSFVVIGYTAFPVNGGANPQFQWKVNGIHAGTNSPVFYYTPVNNDVVTCDLTSSDPCTTGNPATSNPVTMVIYPNLPVSVSITASANPVGMGTPVTYTASPVNGGAFPGYQWKVNGVNSGDNNPQFTYVPIHGDVITCVLTSSEMCTEENPVTSNPLTMVVIQVPFDLSVQNITITDGQIICYDATHTITVAGNSTFFRILNGGSATFIAGSNIVYLPGTQVYLNGYMHGYVAPGGPYCGSQSPSIVTVVTGDKEPDFNGSNPRFTIYPNPTTGTFVIEVQGITVTEKIHIDIFGTHGERITSRENLGKGKHEFSVAHLPVGMYLIRIIDGENVRIFKLLKIIN